MKPQRIGPAGDTEGGRGLLLVEVLSDSWGWYATRKHATTRTIWAELCESRTGMNSTGIGGVHMAGRKPWRG
jgi:hypothetical protein